MRAVSRWPLSVHPPITIITRWKDRFRRRLGYGALRKMKEMPYLGITSGQGLWHLQREVQYCVAQSCWNPPTMARLPWQSVNTFLIRNAEPQNLGSETSWLSKHLDDYREMP